MIVLEFKLKGKAHQYRIIDEMIRTAQFVRNKTLKYWTENQGVKLVNLYKQCAIMAKEFEWASKLNSMARQAPLNVPFWLSNVFLLIAKPKNQEKRGIHSSKNILVL
jgi:putative transposase